jgi:hypothetical protein
MRRPLLVLALVAAAFEADLAAQAPGVPVRNPGWSTGITLGAAIGLSRATVVAGGPGRTATGYSMAATAGLGPLGVGASVTRFDPPGGIGSSTWLGGTAEVKVFGGPLVPLTVLLSGGYATAGKGAGGSTSNRRPSRATLGLVGSLSIPIPVLAVVPWLAPRIERIADWLPGTAGTRGAISGGIDFRSLGGFTVRAAYDSRAGWAGASGMPSVVSVGVGFSFP